MTDSIFENPTDEERPFVEAICARPADLDARLVFADWLEEREDPRAEWLRASVEVERGIRSLGWGFAFRVWRPFARRLLDRDDRIRTAFETCAARRVPEWRELPETLRQAATGHWFCGGFIENVGIGLQGLETFGDEVRRCIPLRGVKVMSGLLGRPENLRRGGPDLWRGIERIVDGMEYLTQGLSPFLSLARAEEFAAVTHDVRALATGSRFHAESLAAFLESKEIESLFVQLPSADASGELERLLERWNPTNLRCLGLQQLVIEGRPVAALAEWPGLREVRLLHFPHLSLGKRSRQAFVRSPYRSRELCVAYPFLKSDEIGPEDEGVTWIDAGDPGEGLSGQPFDLYG